MPLVLLAAGGTGGHLFPAEALAEALGRRGVERRSCHRRSRRALRQGFSGARHPRHRQRHRARARPAVAARARRRCSASGTRAGAAPACAHAAARGRRLRRLSRPCRRCWRRRCAACRPLMHEQNAVMGRANRLLARARRARSPPALPRCSIATPKLSAQGDAHRQSGAAGGDRGCGACPMPPLDEGRSAAAPRLRRQPGRAHHGRHRAGRDREARRAICARGCASCSRRATRIWRGSRRAYARRGVAAEVAPFFADLPARIAASHLVIARSGASTVAELAAIGRPAILVPLPHALDQDQSANAGVLAPAGGAIRLRAERFHARAAGARDRPRLPARRKSSSQWPPPRAPHGAARCRRAARRSVCAWRQWLRGRYAADARDTRGRAMKLPRDIGPDSFRRHRRHRHERHRRGAAQSRLQGAGLGRGRERQCQAAARQGRRCPIGHAAEDLGDAAVVVVSTAIKRDNPELIAARAQAPAGRAPRRDARRADAAQALRRHRRHARQDHDDLARRGAARRRRLRSDRHQWRHHQCLRHQCAARRRRLDGGRGRRDRRHLPEAARRRRRRHQHRSRASRSLRDLRCDARRRSAPSSRTFRSTASR